MEQERRIERYPNAVSIKSHNKRFTVIDKDEDNVLLEFLIVGKKEDVDIPRAHHSIRKGIVTCTQIAIQNERIQDIIDALTAYQEKTRNEYLIENWQKLSKGITFTYINK